MRRMYTDFLVALSFLTRLSPARAVDDVGLARCARYFMPVGCVLGLACAVPVYVWHMYVPQRVWEAAWLYMVCNFWFTRGLHWDALADVGDAWGSHAQGDDFWRIIHDSRVGAFGMMVMLFTFSVLLFAVQGRIHAGIWLPLLLAPAYGRTCAVVFAAWTLPRNVQSLGGKIHVGITPAIGSFYSLVLLLLLLGLPWGEAMGTLMLTGIFLFVVRRLAHKQGGMNGDFMGTVIMGGEVAYLFAI